MADSVLIELARRMIATPSAGPEGTARLARLLGEEVLAHGDLEWRLEAGDDQRQVNLIATKDVAAAPPILLNSHLDTVPPGDASLWSECDADPFAAKIVDGKLYGLGAADAKLDWLCKALALLRFRGTPFRRGVIFAGTFGEETGLRGARALLPRLPQHPAAAWVGEPTELSVVTRHKGLLVVRIAARDVSEVTEDAVATVRLAVHGRSAHSSTPDLGANAIVRALELVRHQRLRIVAVRGGDAANKVPARCELEIAATGPPLPEGLDARETGRTAHPLSQALAGFLFALLREQEAIVALAKTSDASFTPPRLTSNLGRLEAGNGGVEATLDFRCLPGEASEPIVAALDRFLAQEKRRRPIDASLLVERDNPPLHTPADSAVVSWSLRALEGMGLPMGLGAKAGCTEAGVYAAAGIPSVVFGPGRSAGNIHAPNEHVWLRDLERAVEFYARIVGELCR